jgi:hypothetical protein
MVMNIKMAVFWDNAPRSLSGLTAVTEWGWRSQYAPPNHQTPHPPKSALGGLVVRLLANGPKVRGFKSG